MTWKQLTELSYVIVDAIDNCPEVPEFERRRVHADAVRDLLSALCAENQRLRESLRIATDRLIGPGGVVEALRNLDPINVQPPYDHDGECSYCGAKEGNPHPPNCAWETLKEVTAVKDLSAEGK